MKRISFSIFISIIFSSTLFAKIELPSIFSDNMVLQQNSKVAIWGWGNAGETVKIVCSWNIADTVTVIAQNTAKWETEITTNSAGGPYNIQIIGSSKVMYSNVMLGEVWICSGQSNMEMSVNNGIINGETEAADNSNIRIFQIQKIAAEFPQTDCHASWTECTPKTKLETSAVGYFFARELQHKLKIPVGIIVTAWGGTPAEVWIESKRITENQELNSAKISAESQNWPIKPGVLYNSMILPLAPYGIAGVIWYQGESNVANYPVYSLLMKNLIDNWRFQFKKEMPFYFVQIAPFDYGKDGKSAYLREQQDIVSKTVPNTGMITISDLVDDIKNIHPQNKLDVGKRLANFALNETYKQNFEVYKSPSYKAMQIEKSYIKLSFDNVPTFLRSTAKTSSKFQISGADGIFVFANAIIKGKSISVNSKSVKYPIAVRFCFDNTSTPDVFSAEGLPLAPFRTDNF